MPPLKPSVYYSIHFANGRDEVERDDLPKTPAQGTLKLELHI